MSLMEEIKKHQLEARKARDTTTASILTTLLGEAAMVGKNAGRDTTDDEVRAVVKKFVKNNNETYAHIQAHPPTGTYPNDGTADKIRITAENRILAMFLPPTLTEAQLTGVIQKLIDAAVKPTNVGVIMKGVKAALDGNYDYDGAAVSKIAKTLIG